MAYTCQLTEGSLAAINLMYTAAGTAGYSLLAGGIKIGRPEEHDTWGGQLEDKLVRSQDGKRVIPLELSLEGSDGVDMIDRINALQERLDHAKRYQTEGWGDPVYLNLSPNDSPYTVRFLVLKGVLDTDKFYELGREDADKLDSLPVILTCEAYWEGDDTGTLENYIDNPGFWRGAAPGDSWTEVNGGDVTSTIDTTIYEVMGRSLKQVYVVDNANDTGVISDAQTVVASTEYYFEARNYRVAGCDVLTAQVYDATHGAALAASVLTFNGATGAWVKDGVAFTTPAGCVSVQIELYCLAADSVAAGTAYWDAIYLEPRSDAPTGWISGRNLVNHLDAGADHLNVLCVTEIPGEREAEVKYTVRLDDQTSRLRLGKRTRSDPHNFIWHLTPCGAHTTAEGAAGGACAPGLIDALCRDSDKIVDATSPSGSRITVSFAGFQSMQPRCYWDITDDLTSYYGKFALYVIAKMSGGTDTATMEIGMTDETSHQGRRLLEGVGIDIKGISWSLYDGWQVWMFRIGTHDNDLFGTGNNWRIELWASTDGIPTDELHIAGAYLTPLDEGILVAGTGIMAVGADFIIKKMDGDRGAFAYSTATDTYYANLGAVGQYPLVNPKVENYIYLVSASPVWVLDDAFHVSLQYRPRGVFLRGSNP